MDGWDLALLAIAGYVAIVALVRLMIRRRDQLVGELVEEAEQKKRRQAAAPPPPPSPPRQGKIA